MRSQVRSNSVILDLLDLCRLQRLRTLKWPTMWPLDGIDLQSSWSKQTMAKKLTFGRLDAWWENLRMEMLCFQENLTLINCSIFRKFLDLYLSKCKKCFIRTLLSLVTSSLMCQLLRHLRYGMQKNFLKKPLLSCQKC